MSLTNCPDCHTTFSNKALTCPTCGCPLWKDSRTLLFLRNTGAAAIVILCIAFTGYYYHRHRLFLRVQARESLYSAGIPVSGEGFVRAISHDNTRAVEHFMTLGYSPNELVGEDTPINWANSNTMRTFLLRAGADPNRPSKRGSFPLIRAIRDAQTVELLLRHGADTEVTDTEGLTPLLLAAIRRKKEAMKLLLEYGANTEATDSEGRTALFFAITKRSLSMGKMLIDAGADVRTLDKAGATPLALAKRKKFTSFVNALVEAGAGS